VAAAENIEHLLCWGQYLGADAVAGDEGNAVVRRHAVDCSKAVRGASKTQSGYPL
jgi:hypothetical protein